MVSYPKRLRYPHKIRIRRHVNEVFSGKVLPSIPINGYPTDTKFKLCLVSSGICRIKIIGTYDGSEVIERISFGEAGTQYTSNFFHTLTSINSSYYIDGVEITISSVDSVGMPVSWTQIYGPYRAEFGQMNGMQAQIDANALGLGSKVIHYVRVERSAKLSKDMEFTVDKGRNIGTKIYVPISDFEDICIPPDYVPSEWAFRCTMKTEGE